MWPLTLQLRPKSKIANCTVNYGETSKCRNFNSKVWIKNSTFKKYPEQGHIYRSWSGHGLHDHFSDPFFGSYYEKSLILCAPQQSNNRIMWLQLLYQWQAWPLNICFLLVATALQEKSILSTQVNNLSWIVSQSLKINISYL